MGKEITRDINLKAEKEYLQFFHALKKQISIARVRAASALNKQVIQLYWSIGKHVLEKQEKTSWGDKLLDHLSLDLRNAFPEMRGFSKTNLKYMRILAHLYPDGIGQQCVDQLPWGHVTLLIRLKNAQERHWYVSECLVNGWSRHVLEKQIRSNLYQRQFVLQAKSSNFLASLPEPQSLLAHELLKNPYNFDCLGLHDDAQEREIEHSSIQYITRFLLELGKGFTFYGRQVPVHVGEQEFFIDMLFYHVKLHCFVVVEIKAVPFKPEHAGQLNFYLSAVDEQIKGAEDNPSIGLLLCKSRDKVVAEYALRDIKKPIGISEYQLTKAIPENLKTELPSIGEIEASLNSDKN